jgi:hypothetical protein
LDERLGLEAIIAAHLSDSRHGLNTQFPLPDLLRQSIYSRLAGYEDLNEAARLSTERSVVTTPSIILDCVSNIMRTSQEPRHVKRDGY